METDDRELLNALFAKATAMLEDAVELVAAGQSPNLSPSQLAEYGRRLQMVAREIAIIGDAAAIIAERIPGPPHA